MKKKMNLATEIDLTQDSVVQLTCWCGQIALHELWGLGRVRLDRITRRQEQLGNESLAVVMVPDRNGMPQTEKARQLRAEALPELFAAPTKQELCLGEPLSLRCRQLPKGATATTATSGGCTSTGSGTWPKSCWARAPRKNWQSRAFSAGRARCAMFTGGAARVRGLASAK